MIVKKIVLPIATAVALVHVTLYGYWFYRSALPTLRQAVRQDGYDTLHSFLRETPRTVDGRKTRFVLVGTRTEFPSRFEQEVYYELYPEVPSKYELDGAAIAEVLGTFEKGDTVLAETKLDLEPKQFIEVPGESYFIYRHQ